MRAHATALLLVGLTFGCALSAWAESPTARPSGGLEQRDPPPGAGAARPAEPTAPVGHRQPQAKDVAPADIPPADQATQDLDKALAKKLTICRGC